MLILFIVTIIVTSIVIVTMLPAPLLPSQRVRFTGLTRRADLNGLVGTVIRYDAAKEQYAVKCDSTSETVLIKRSSLVACAGLETWTCFSSLYSKCADVYETMMRGIKTLATWGQRSPQGGFHQVAPVAPASEDMGAICARVV